MEYSLDELNKFLYRANANGYAGDGVKVKAQRPGFEELEYKEGDWLYHDSYAGHFFAPGQEEGLLLFLKKYWLKKKYFFNF